MHPIPVPDSRQQLLVSDPLYTRYELGALEWGGLIRRALDSGTIDLYCPECERPSVFRIDSGHGRDDLVQKLLAKTWFVVEARCTRDHRTLGAGTRCDGRFLAVFVREGGAARKAGLYPPKGDLEGAFDPELARELSPELLAALGRAFALRDLGVGAGAFVYLRRVFAALLERAEREGAPAPGARGGGPPEPGIAARIAALAEQLPPRVARDAGLFALLDRPAHELDEGEALAHFDLVFQAIAMILRHRQQESAYREIVAKLDEGRHVGRR